MWCTSLLIATLLCLLSHPSHAAEQKPIIASERKNFESPFTEDFSKLANDALKEWHVAGLAISVIDGDEMFAKVC